MKKPKTTSPKKKWLKQCGDFVFKNPRKKEWGSIIVSVYYKNERIGIISCVNQKEKDSYFLSIYNFAIIKQSYGTAIGTVHCSGLVKQLPKTIVKVKFNANLSILVSTRKVLVEKYQSLEKRFGYLLY